MLPTGRIGFRRGRGCSLLAGRSAASSGTRPRQGPGEFLNREEKSDGIDPEAFCMKGQQFTLHLKSFFFITLSISNQNHSDSIS
jgi:hypothetical protein